METTALIAACVAVVLGAGLQRVAGMGLGMVAAPVLTVLLGASVGVLVSNVAAIVTALLILRALRDRVEWRRVVTILPLMLVGSVLGALTVREADAAWLDVIVGGSVLLALAASAVLRRRVRIKGRSVAVATGLAAGFMNTTSGVAAPAWTAYALATRWDHKSFAATLQPLLVVMNTMSVATKLAFGAIPPGHLPAWWVWPLLLAGVLAGVGLGALLARRIPTRIASAIALTVAVAGALTALTRGVLTV
ncbi:sulfite exporter TauE/SafE family protein [Promicromonospora sp. NPDC023805]|uniref:sulfite exporter TauE/SafE family protein n=1 Tax=Promicromonospora sp. NPDC023805 TaxID=3154696 RepID=UPI00340E7DD2